MLETSSYAVAVLSADFQQVSTWAGGETTQIAISPVGAHFRDLRFDWRVSRASVLQDGTFTKFPGYERILLLLSGRGILIDHPGRESHVLNRHLVPYPFSGDWETSGSLLSGPVIDFNVIYARGRIHASVDPYELRHFGDVASIALHAGVHLVYCAFGEAEAAYATAYGHYYFKEGEALLMVGEQLQPSQRNGTITFAASKPDTVLIDVQIDRV